MPVEARQIHRPTVRGSRGRYGVAIINGRSSAQVPGVPAAAAVVVAGVAAVSPISNLLARHRGPGDVTYDTDDSLLNKGDAKLFRKRKPTYFSEPGDTSCAPVNDSSGDGGGGDQCCWTPGT
jgi:hypothetical protein